MSDLSLRPEPGQRQTPTMQPTAAATALAASKRSARAPRCIGPRYRAVSSYQSTAAYHVRLQKIRTALENFRLSRGLPDYRKTENQKHN
jgi:hypothetical protein